MTRRSSHRDTAQRRASGSGDLIVRRADDSDEPAVLELLRTSLGWTDADPNLALFRWKHYENPAGRSPAWVAVADGQIVGYRTFLLWRFSTASGVLTAVRAVDTATHPSYQGRGIFSRLTLHALEELKADGLVFVFNTPNDRSRPGYLKMGWQPVGRLPISVVPRGVARWGRILSARTSADRWSMVTDAGVAALAAIGGSALPEVVTAGADEIRTLRSLNYLRWRYGLAPLNYRGLTSPDGGLAIFRLRRRGAATEAAISELFAPSRAARRALVHLVLDRTGADYAVSLGPGRVGFPLPGQGPLLVQRPLAGTAPTDLSSWRLSLGDIELF